MSPDGTMVLTGSCDNTARLWDRDTGEELKQFKVSDRTSNFGYTLAAFSPDGKTILTNGSDGTVRLWNVKTGKQTQLVMSNKSSLLASFSPNGKSVLIVKDSKSAFLYDISTREQYHLTVPYKASIHSLAFSFDSRTILFGLQKGAAYLWDVVTRKEVPLFFEDLNETNSMNFSAFSKNGYSALGVLSKGYISILKPVFDLTAEQEEEEAWNLFKGKALYAVLSDDASTRQEQNSSGESNFNSTLDDSSQIDLCSLQ